MISVKDAQLDWHPRGVQGECMHACSAWLRSTAERFASANLYRQTDRLFVFSDAFQADSGSSFCKQRAAHNADRYWLTVRASTQAVFKYAMPQHLLHKPSASGLRLSEQFALKPFTRSGTPARPVWHLGVGGAGD